LNKDPRSRRQSRRPEIDPAYGNENGHEAVEAEDSFDGLKAAKRTIPNLGI